MMDLLMYVLTTMLWLAFAWVTACIYLTIRYKDDGKKYEVCMYRSNIEDKTYDPIKVIWCVHFPTAYLIIGARPYLRLTSPLTDEIEYDTVMLRISNKYALGIPLAGPLKDALSKKYNI